MKHMWSEEEISSQKKDIATLVDSKGNPRFIEGNGTPISQAGITISYCKWSLSGTHLMCVVAGSIANGTTISNGAKIAKFPLPDYIMNKIVAVWATYIIERKSYTLYDNSWASQTNPIVLGKYNTLDIQQSADFTATSEKHFRYQFDLLIDSE